MLTLDETIVAAATQVSSDLGDEVVVLDLQAGVYHGLEGVGARIWSLIQQPARIADVRDEVLAEYDVEPGRCESDLLALLEELSAKGLVQRSE